MPRVPDVRLDRGLVSDRNKFANRLNHGGLDLGASCAELLAISRLRFVDLRL